MTFAQEILVQSWTMYAIGVILIGARVVSRRIQEGTIKRLWLEEYLMFFVLAVFTAFTWSVNEVAVNGSNYMSLEQAESLTPNERQHTIYGSKMTLVMEMLTLTTIWTVKLCLCVMFYRLTSKLDHLNTIVKILGGYCITAYVLIVVLLLSYWCRPFSGFWAVPVVNSQCATYYHHMYFATAWNIFADLCLLAIPLKIIPGLQLPWKRKVLVLGVLMLGVFNILAAILNRYYNWAHPDSVEYVKWYIGEVGTAVYVVNVPACWPLVRKLFPWVTRTNTNVTASATANSGYQLRSHGQNRSNIKTNAGRSHHGLSESEENLALDEATFGKSTSAWPGSAYNASADAKSGESDESIMQAGTIVKTMEVSQQASYWRNPS